MKLYASLASILLVCSLNVQANNTPLTPEQIAQIKEQQRQLEESEKEKDCDSQKYTTKAMTNGNSPTRPD